MLWCRYSAHAFVTTGPETKIPIYPIHKYSINKATSRNKVFFKISIQMESLKYNA